MKLYAILFLLVALLRLVDSLLNINRKKLSSYESKRFKVLDDKYFKIIFTSDLILFVVIAIVSLLSSKIDSIGLYAAICSLTAVLTMELCKFIGLRKIYIKKIL